MSFYRKQKGVALVEFAIVLVPLVLMVFGITELGRAFYQYNTLVKSTRDAARFLSTQAAGTGYAEATCLAVVGRQSCTTSDMADPAQQLAPNLTVDLVTICDATTPISPACPSTYKEIPTGSGVINLVTVSITGYQFSSVISYVVPPIIKFGTISTTMRQIL